MRRHTSGKDATCAELILAEDMRVASLGELEHMPR